MSSLSDMYDVYKITKEDVYINGRKYFMVKPILMFRGDFDGNNLVIIPITRQEDNWDEEKMKRDGKDFNPHRIIKDLFTAKTIR